MKHSGLTSSVAPCDLTGCTMPLTIPRAYRAQSTLGLSAQSTTESAPRIKQSSHCRHVKETSGGAAQTTAGKLQVCGKVVIPVSWTNSA